MKYLKLFSEHSAYNAASSTLQNPSIAYDHEHLHYSSNTDQEPIAKFIIMDGSYTTIEYSKDIYKYEDINVAKAEYDMPASSQTFIVYPNSSDSFGVLVSVDGVETCKLMSSANYEINDDLLSQLGGESCPLTQYKGQYLAYPVRKTYGFIYEGVTYMRTGRSASTFASADAVSTGEMISIYNYESSDGQLIWVTTNYNAEKKEDGVADTTVMCEYTAGDQYVKVQTSIAVVTTSDYVD